MEPASAKRFNQKHYVVSTHSITQFRARYTEKIYRALKDSEIATMIDQMVYQGYLSRDLQFIHDTSRNEVSRVIKLPPKSDGKVLYAILRSSDYFANKETIITLLESHMREGYLERGRWKVVSAAEYGIKAEEKPKAPIPSQIKMAERRLPGPIELNLPLLSINALPIEIPIFPAVHPPVIEAEKRRRHGSIQVGALELVKQAGEQGIKAADIAKALGIERMNIGKALGRLKEMGKVEMLGLERSPHCRWRLPQSKKKVEKKIVPPTNTKEIALHFADLLEARAQVNRAIKSLEETLAGARENLAKLEIEVANTDLALHRAAEQGE